MYFSKIAMLCKIIFFKLLKTKLPHNKSNLIDSSEISVVVQGNIHAEYTPAVLASIRKFLPKAEIVLSTWINCKCDDLDYDIIVKNIDPGAEIFVNGQPNNLNRQIVSTKNGIQKANRKYILKTRTDISLTSANFLNFFGKFLARNSKCKILNSRVLVCNRFVRDPRILPFHVSDWVFFGFKEDVKNIWDIPLAPEPETTHWFESHKLMSQHKRKGEKFSWFRHRYCQEQYIWFSFLSKYIKIKFDNSFDISHKNIILTDISFANNLVILSKKQYGIDFLKGDYYKDNHFLYDYSSWIKLYKKYCRPLKSEAIFMYKTLISFKILNKFNQIKQKKLKHIIDIQKTHLGSHLYLLGLLIYKNGIDKKTKLRDIRFFGIRF